jgi:hypothetical protein
VTNLIVIAPVCCDATLRLDARASTDVDNDPLTYIWLTGTNILSTDAITTNRFQPGSHEITLVVSDGNLTSSTNLTVEIVTCGEAAQYLKTLVGASIAEPRDRMPLANWLRQAEESFARCHVAQGIQFLELFKRRVTDRLLRNDPELATSLIEAAEAIIEAAPDCDPCRRLGRPFPRSHQHPDHQDHNDRDNQSDNDRGSQGQGGTPKSGR